MSEQKVGVLDSVLQVEWDDLFDAAARLGFNGVELGVRRDYASTALWSEAGRKRLLKRSQDAGIPVASICLHSYWQLSFATPEPEIQAEARRLAREAAAIAAEFGAKAILIPVTNAPNTTNGEAMERWTAGMTDVARAGVEHGVSFGLENVSPSFVKGAHDIVQIVDKVLSPAVGVYYDPGNAISVGNDPVAEIDALGPRIVQVHVKASGGTYLDEGKARWDVILQALQDVEYSGWYVFETKPTEQPLEAAERNLKVFKGVLNG